MILPRLSGVLSSLFQDPGIFISFFFLLSFAREGEIVASTHYLAPTLHTLSFTLPSPAPPTRLLRPGLLRSSGLSSTPSNHSVSDTTSPFPHHDPFSHAPPSSFPASPGLSLFRVLHCGRLA